MDSKYPQFAQCPSLLFALFFQPRILKIQCNLRRLSMGYCLLAFQFPRHMVHKDWTARLLNRYLNTLRKCEDLLGVKYYQRHKFRPHQLFDIWKWFLMRGRHPGLYPKETNEKSHFYYLNFIIFLLLSEATKCKAWKI